MKSSSKNILITGVSTGIGWGAAHQFIEQGYTVFGSVRKASDADRLQREWGERFVPLLFDVTDAEAVAEAAQSLTGRLAGSGLAGLVNNAGIAIGGPLQHQPMAEIRQQFEVNVFGLLQVTQAFLPLLGARENHPVPPGRILNISSVGGKIAAPFIGAYAGTKFAVEGLSHSLRRELQLYGIDVIVIGPGAVNTPIWDKGVDASPYVQTAYGPAITRFVKNFIEEGRVGFTPDYLGRQIVRIFETPNPKTRYALVPKRLERWVLPRLLPDRLLDRILGRLTGLRPAKG
ncbi:short-chain dehydrogenase/reductase SDR [Fibrisoma limi BUZ 3]|uniref:Short-chain dehydrogenase/reductase SDR n=1 Tax=Fibrisoma limi BUZ 3 TaxID=1185876 RepID=I2GD83_9BACT|nr:SDR family NAD(P)-dependent oxidoreductase [Fibrisoma limi]CCH51857.1 short-chain dehydrogenase/reductase SDR [Fibrisoma limi BUZ 3]